MKVKQTPAYERGKQEIFDQITTVEDALKLEAIFRAVETDTYEPPWAGKTFVPIGRYSVKAEDGQIQRRLAAIVIKRKKKHLNLIAVTFVD